VEISFSILKGLVLQRLHHQSAIFKILLPGFFPFNISIDINRITHTIDNVSNGLEAPILNSATDFFFLSRVDSSKLGHITRDLPLYVAATHMKATQYS